MTIGRAQFNGTFVLDLCIAATLGWFGYETQAWIGVGIAAGVLIESWRWLPGPDARHAWVPEEVLTVVEGRRAA